jgi:thiol-disulfide isomerase/thioredoxin
MTNHTVVTLEDPRLDSEHLRGRHPELGDCQFALSEVAEILLGGAESTELVYTVPRLTAKRATEPKFDITAEGKYRINSPLVGSQLQDMEFPLLNDQVRRLFEYEGKVLVLDFWATWCAPCVKNMPAMIEMVNELPASEVEFLAVNYQEEKHIVEEMRATRGWEIEIALDPTGFLGRKFLVESLPQTVVIDQQGKVAAVFVGAGTDLHTEIRAVVEDLMAE